MGYTTDFEGHFAISPQLNKEHQDFIQKFSNVRHMKRDPVAAAKMPDPIRIAVGLDVGDWGKHYVGSTAFAGQDREGVGGVVDFNQNTPGCPGLWCQWEPTEDGTSLRWNGGEKFYKYVDWLQYLIDEYLRPWGYVLDGDVSWQGEREEDKGVIRVRQNVISTIDE